MSLNHCLQSCTWDSPMTASPQQQQAHGQQQKQQQDRGLGQQQQQIQSSEKEQRATTLVSNQVMADANQMTCPWSYKLHYRHAANRHWTAQQGCAGGWGRAEAGVNNTSTNIERYLQSQNMLAADRHQLWGKAGHHCATAG